MTLEVADGNDAQPVTLDDVVFDAGFVVLGYRIHKCWKKTTGVCMYFGSHILMGMHVLFLCVDYMFEDLYYTVVYVGPEKR